MARLRNVVNRSVEFFVCKLIAFSRRNSHTYISTKPVTNPSKFKYGRKDVDRASMLCMRIRRRWTTGNGIHNPGDYVR